MITISINIQVDATDLAVLGQQLAAIARGMALLQAPDPERGHSGREGSKPQNGLEAHGTDVREGNIPADGVALNLAAIAPATATANGAAFPVTTVIQKNKRGTPTLPFPEFDALCRKEMKRLSLDKRLPGRRLWDEERDKRLPTLDAVRMRYRCATMEQLAEELGFEPPIRGGKVEAPHAG